MKTLLVTGGCGFIGSNFIHYLFEETDFSANLVNVDKLTYAGNPKNLEDISRRFQDRYTFVHADIADSAAMARVFADHPISAVCHFAAETHVDRSIAGPEAFVMTNIMGTFRLLEESRKLPGLELFHLVSTDEVFGSLGQDGFFVEHSPYKPNSPYAASKASADLLARSYFKTYGFPFTISHCGNNYGPYQFPEKLVPLVIENALEGRPIPVYGKGDNVRDWLYVKDHCAAIWRIMQKSRPGQTYNVGGHGEVSNINLISRICDTLDRVAGPADFGPRKSLITFVQDRPGHDFRYALDTRKIQKELAWTPSVTLETGLENTICWYLENRKWVKSVKNGEYKEWITRQYGLCGLQ